MGVLIMLSISNKFYTWEQMVALYPDKWVVVENAKLTSGGFIEEGELIAVGDSKEIDDFVVECYLVWKSFVLLFCKYRLSTL